MGMHNWTTDWPEDRLMFHRVVSPLVYHCLLSIYYFIWYFFQRPTPQSTSQKMTQLEPIGTASPAALEPSTLPEYLGQATKCRSLISLQGQLLSLPIDDVVGGSEPRGPIRQRDFDFRHK